MKKTRKTLTTILATMLAATGLEAQSKTLVVYYSYTGNTEEIVETLSSKISADVVEVEPATRGIDYAANNYAIGSALIGAIRSAPDESGSYPAIDTTSIDWDEYATVIIASPLWWSQMAAPMQTFLFENGAAMAGKNVGLIVSSYSSSIGGVESDMTRLVPEGKRFAKSLWINNSTHSDRSALIDEWLTDIKYAEMNKTETSKMNITINGRTMACELADNTSAQALVEQLKRGDISYEAHDYGGFEKVGDIGISLPENDEEITTEAGDVILYLGRNICIYYAENTWDFTRLGKITGVTDSELKEIVGAGQGEVSVTLSLAETSSQKEARSVRNGESVRHDLGGRVLSGDMKPRLYVAGKELRNK